MPFRPAPLPSFYFYFQCAAAHTMLAGLKDDEKVQGRKADVIAAADQGAEAAMRLIKPGKKNTDVATALTTVREL